MSKVSPADVTKGSSGGKLVSGFRAQLTAKQIQLRANKRFQAIVGWTTILAVFIDILG